MNFYQLAIQNVRGNWRSYKAFILSNCVSVAIFFMYTSFIYHPDIIRDSVYENIRSGLLTCNYMVVVTSTFFIVYSNKIFLQSRKKEFGLFMLTGITKGRFVLLIVLEQILVGLIAMLFGIILGVLFSKLFFMMLSLLLNLNESIPFVWNIKVFFITSSVYGIFFLILSFFSVWKIWKLQVIDLLKEGKISRVINSSSILFFIIGILCVGTGYIVATQVTLLTFGEAFIPIVVLVMGGTYLFFIHGNAMVLKIVEKWKRILYRYPNLFVIRNLTFKIKENAQFLFVNAALTTVILCVSGSMYTYYSDMTEQIIDEYPHTFSYTEKGINSKEIIDSQVIQTLLRKYHFQDERKIIVEQLPATISSKGHDVNVTVVSESDFNREAKEQKKLQVHNQDKSGTLVVLQILGGLSLYDEKTTKVQVKLQNQMDSFHLNGQYNIPIFNKDNSRTQYIFIVNESEFQRLEKRVPNSEKFVYYGYDVKQWETAEPLIREIREQIKEENRQYVKDRTITYNSFKNGSSLIIFIGGFISFLFFVATCSLTYFKWFNDIEQDRMQVKSLMKIGMMRQEVKKIISRQIGIIFFAPIIVAVMHSTVALYALGRIFTLHLWKTSFVVFSIYVLGAYIYFLLARKEYMKHVY